MNILPLGSIVLLKGGSQKLLIIGRALNLKKDEKEFYFDYGGVPYPHGLTGDQIAYFNADAINKIVFEGYSDVDNENTVDTINDYLKNHPDLKRGSVESFQK